MKHLKDLSKAQIKAFIESFDTVLSDINGVLVHSEAIPGAAEALKALSNAGKTIRYVSNNSALTPDEYGRLFATLGVRLKRNDLIHPTVTLLDYLKTSGFRGKLFCIASEPAMEMMAEDGVRTVSDEYSYVKTAADLMKRIADEPEAGAVYVDLDPNANYGQLCKALTLLERDDVQLIFGATDAAITVTSTKNILGPGPFQDILSRRSGRTATLLGKPSEYLKSMILKRYAIEDPGRVLIIGDMLNQDMIFGSMCGFQKLLVFSGVTKPDDLKAVDDLRLMPDYCTECIADLVPILEPQ